MNENESTKAGAPEGAAPETSETTQRPPSFWFGDLTVLDGLRAGAAEHMLAVAESIEDEPELAEEITRPFLIDLNAWNIAMFVDFQTRIPPAYMRALYNAALALAHRAIRYAHKQKGD